MNQVNNESFETVNRVIESIPQEVCRSPQPEFLYRLSSNTKGLGAVVEIGTNVGKTAIALAYGQKCKKGSPITSIDIYRHPDIRENLRKAGVSDYVECIVGSSWEVVKTWSKPIELLWIDGDHACTGVTLDIKRWAPFVTEGGLIALHDYPGHRRSMEVWRALRKTLLKRPYQYRLISDREAGSIIVFEKISPPPAPPGAKRIKNRFYWRCRNLRSLVVRFLPGLARNVKVKSSGQQH